MENCLYRGNLICAYDLKDQNGYYYEEKVLEWKEAAAKGLLLCSECQERVYLAAGPIKEPYFAHYDSQECDYGNRKESEELKTGKRILYQLARRSFPQALVRVRHRMENGMYSTVFCKLEDHKAIAIDYRLQNNSLSQYNDRDTYYIENNITPIYVLGIKQKQNNSQMTWYQNLIQRSMGYCVFLDTQKERIVLQKCISYRIGKTRKFKYCEKSFLVNEITLAKNGEFLCDFYEESLQMEKQIQEEREQHHRIMKQVKLAKAQRTRQELLELERTSKNPMGLNAMLYDKCKRMIEEGNGHLVSRKYYDAIMNSNK